MANSFYARVKSFVRLTRAQGPEVQAEFDNVETGFDAVETETNKKVTGPSGDEAGWALPAPVAGRAIQFNAAADGLEASSTAIDDVVTDAEAARDAAQAAQTAAETAKTNAETAETNAETAETNAEGHETTAQEWATKTASKVDATDWSAKAYAQNDLTGADGGSAKDWATTAEDSTVDGAEFSAKHYAAKAAASASAAATSAGQAAASTGTIAGIREFTTASTDSVEADRGKLIEGNRATAQTYVVKKNIHTLHDVIYLEQVGAGQVTVTADGAGGVTFRYDDVNHTLGTLAKGSKVTIICVDDTVDANVFSIGGALDFA